MIFTVLLLLLMIISVFGGSIRFTSPMPPVAPQLIPSAIPSYEPFSASGDRKGSSGKAKGVKGETQTDEKAKDRVGVAHAKNSADGSKGDGEQQKQPDSETATEKFSTARNEYGGGARRRAEEGDADRMADDSSSTAVEPFTGSFEYAAF